MAGDGSLPLLKPPLQTAPEAGGEGLGLLEPARIPLGLYAHFPWCVRKCPYCDFNSHEAAGEVPDEAYGVRLLEDLRGELAADVRPVQTVFIGGGTPSLMQPGLAGALLEAAARRGALAEATLEANPGAVDAGRFAAYRRAGVNRLSLGFQSLNAQSLRLLGRIHSAEEARHAYRLARRAGFASINIDLMHGLPQQSVGDALCDLSGVLALEPEHVSWYQLTIEKNTRFYSQPPPLPGEAALEEMQARGAEALRQAGYRQYEVSAWARPGYECRHNLNYWRFGDYIGIGAGAHGKRSLAGGQIVRRRKTRMPGDYLAGGGAPALAEPVAAEDLPLEFLMNALRLTEGFAAALYEQRTGLPFATLRPFIAQGQAQGLLAYDPAAQRLRPTERGLRYLDSLLQLALPSASSDQSLPPPRGSSPNA